MKMKKFAIFVKKSLKINILNLEITVIIQMNTGVLLIVYVIYNVPIEIPIVLHNRSNYDYHFTIKELAEKFEEQSQCLGENTKKYILLAALV